jgi:hypothetical protein
MRSFKIQPQMLEFIPTELRFFGFLLQIACISRTGHAYILRSIILKLSIMLS